MKKDLVDLKKLVVEVLSGTALNNHENIEYLNKIIHEVAPSSVNSIPVNQSISIVTNPVKAPQTIEVEESLSLEEKEKTMIKKALEKYRGKRKNAAKELGISERTLYRKINEYNLK
jgi:transcriptional regulator with PAS, ATPase and Fis domain